jgi:Leucine-rich repeat (LRR) protein
MLVSVPAEMGNLQNLRELNLYNNQLREIPAEFGNLNLREIGLRNNNISVIPMYLQKFNIY